MAQEGVVFAILIIDEHFTLTKPPEFISRGFIFKTDEDQIFGQARRVIDRQLKQKKRRIFNDHGTKQELARVLEQFFFDTTGRRPLIGVEIVQI